MNNNNKPSSIRIWRRSLQNAMQVSKLQLSEHAEAYLAYTLDHYMYELGAGMEKPLGMTWIAVINNPLSRKHHYRRIGDTCLIVCSLFPQQARQHNTSLHNYITIGKSAYATVADMPECVTYERQLYLELHLKFVPITQTLAIIKHPQQ
jgi:hypothetical protein